MTRQIDKTDYLRALGAYLVPRHLLPLCRRQMLQVDTGRVPGRHDGFTCRRKPEDLEGASGWKSWWPAAGLTSIPTLDVRPVSTSCLCLNNATRAWKLKLETRIRALNSTALTLPLPSSRAPRVNTPASK